MMKLWVVIYSHKYGIDVFPHKTKKGAEKTIKELSNQEDFNLEDDVLEIYETNLYNN